MISWYIFTALLLGALAATQGYAIDDPCPQIQCPMQESIPRGCRLKTFVIGTDEQTKCRVCDRNKCTDPPITGDVCPQIQCPNDHKIPKGCRMGSFVIGLDEITKCRVCDRNKCRG